MEWKKVSQRRKYDGWRAIDGVTFDLPTGIQVEYDIVQSGYSACVLALTPENQVILAKQFRPGPEKELLELPGGAVDSGEELTDAIRRELLEETGYTGDFRLVGSEVRDAYSTATGHCFVATNCLKVQEPENHPREPIEIVLMSLEDFRKHLFSGQLSDTASGYRGLEYLGLL